jgi:Protein of unknown function (DUF3106)
MLKRSLSSLALLAVLLMSLPSWARDGGDNWRNLSPKEKENVQRNYQRWQNLPPPDKEHLREEWDRWQNLPQDRRDQLKRRYEDQRRHRPND